MPQTKRQRKYRSNKNTMDKKVKAIIKKQIDIKLKKKVELKHFDSNTWRNLAPIPAAAGANFSCIGFTSGVNANSQGGAYQYPNGTDIYQLRLLNPFKSNAVDPELRKYAIEGREITPLTALTKYVVSREAEVNPTTGTGSAKLRHSAPVLCRVIQVVPRMSSGIATEPNPADDLFLDNRSNPLGVNSVQVDEIDVMNYPINKRRYTVTQDFKFVIKNPFNISWVANPNANPPSVPNYLAQIAPNNGYCQRTIKSYTQLAKRKGDKLFYQAPNENTTTNATSGHQRTYTLFHFMYQGVENFGDDDTVKSPTDLYLDVNTLSRFTDM